MYGSEALEVSEKMQRASTEIMSHERRQLSNTEIIHHVLRRSIATAKSSIEERIRRAGTDSTYI